MERQYYIESEKDYLGPFTLSELKDKKLKSDTLIWYEGLEYWTKSEDLEELKANIPSVTSPLVKAVYFLFLKYPNGILFKELSNYKYVLQSIYNIVSLRENMGSIEKSIDDICNPLENSINEKCSRIKESFLFHFENDIAMNYYITGERGCPKFISIDRKLITCHDMNLLNL